MKIDLRCDKCGSDDVNFDGWGSWSIYEQDYNWEVTGAWCNVCQENVPIVEIEIQDG